MDGMEVGVITNGMLFERGDDIRAPALLEDARLFPDDFKGGVDAALGKQLAQPLGRIVIGGGEVVFRIEPEDDVDRWGLSSRRPQGKQPKREHKCANESLIVTHDFWAHRHQSPTRESAGVCRSERGG